MAKSKGKMDKVSIRNECVVADTVQAFPNARAIADVLFQFRTKGFDLVFADNVDVHGHFVQVNDRAGAALQIDDSCLTNGKVVESRNLVRCCESQRRAEQGNVFNKPACNKGNTKKVKALLVSSIPR